MMKKNAIHACGDTIRAELHFLGHSCGIVLLVSG